MNLNKKTKQQHKKHTKNKKITRIQYLQTKSIHWLGTYLPKQQFLLYTLKSLFHTESRRVLMYRKFIFLTLIMFSFILRQGNLYADSLDTITNKKTLHIQYIDVPQSAESLITNVKIPIAYAVRLANQQNNKIGSLWINYGGPGISAIDQLEDQLQLNAIPTEILNRFDLVVFDPRGTGKSAFADEFNQCNTNQTCSIITKKYASYIGTNYVAHDMEHLRQHLRMNKINLLGYSYGTRLFSVYHYYYGQYVRAVILDGMDSLNSNQLKANLTKAITIQTLLDDKLSQMTKLTGDFPLFSSINQVSNAFDDSGVHFYLNPKKKLSKLSSTSLVNLLFYDTSTSQDEELNNVLSIVNCSDQHTIYTAQDIDRVASLLDDFEQSIFYSLTEPCLSSHVFGFNAIPTEDKISRAFQNKRIKPLIISAEYDSLTPHNWSEQAVQKFDADLITLYHGTEHGLTFSGYECIDEQVVDYLTKLSPSQYDCNAEDMTKSINRESEQEILELITNAANYL